MRPEIANEVAVGQARLQLSVVASSANLDSLHLDKRNGDTALHLAQRTDGAVCTIDGKKGNSVIIGKANLAHVSRIVLAHWQRKTYHCRDICLGWDLDHGRVCRARVSLPPLMSRREQRVLREYYGCAGGKLRGKGGK